MNVSIILLFPYFFRKNVQVEYLFFGNRKNKEYWEWGFSILSIKPAPDFLLIFLFYVLLIFFKKQVKRLSNQCKRNTTS